ncbi:MAG: type IV pilus assembly protein PilM [Candidatus Omnitrophica bacterium]|nr:type IV pilus assembly protein PilM [Candidatus Omnitrophota bacterium]
MINSLLKFKNNFSKEKLSLGLDIGTSDLKIVKLKLTKDIVELSSFGLESGKFDLAEALKKIKQQHIADSVNISVSGPQTVIRYVNFPRMNNTELKQALKFEAQKHIPFAVNEVNLDGYILKDNLADNKMLVLIAAVKKELVNQRLKMIGDAGFRVNTVGIDSIALANAFNFNYPSLGIEEHKAVALLNIGASVTNLDILEEGLPRLSRDLHIAGNSFTQKIMDIFNLDFNNAEKLKLNPDEERANKVKAAVESVLANLASEIRTSFDYYESQSTSSVVKIFLSGGGALFNGLKETLAHFVGIEVEYWDPLKQIGITELIDRDKLKVASAQLTIAIGLALRS